MLAKVKCHRNLARSIAYNEEKVDLNKAKCLLAANFIKDADSLSTEDKLARFSHRTSLHEGSVCNAVHISLNFSAKDEISNEKMTTMAQHYMNAIGFGHQPFLVYRHFDTHHPHTHVVSTNITAEGKRIQMHDIVNKVSREIVREMEDRFSLTKNQRSVTREEFQVQRAQMVVQGEAGIKRGISDVLNTVIPHYNYTTFDELNAVLRLYNVAAHRGEEGSRLYQTGGLLYYALNDEGNRISLPVKASSFLLKPTLPMLERQFAINQVARVELSHHINTYADWILNMRAPSWNGFQKAMEKEGISIVLLPNKKTGEEGVFFVHHLQKCVYAGESLGPEYGLRSLQERCSLEQQQEQTLRQRHSLRL